MEFIELCLNSSKDEKIAFACTLDQCNQPEVYFNIVENNEFKSLTHLSLKFRSANDEMIKNYLATGWKTKKSEYEAQYERYTNMSENYDLKYSQSERLADEMRNVTEEAYHREEKLKNDYEKKINLLKEQFQEKENNWMKNYEGEKFGVESRFKEREELLLAKVERQERVSSELQEKKLELESKDKENRSKIRVLESEYNSSASECENQRKLNKDQEILRFNHEKLLTELEVHIFFDKTTD